MRCLDTELLLSVISPMGQSCRLLTKAKDETHSVFVRSHSSLTESQASINIWQLLPANPLSIDVLKDGSLVRLRHVLSGLYLSMRFLEPSELHSIKDDVLMMPERKLFSEKRSQSKSYHSDPQSLSIEVPSDVEDSAHAMQRSKLESSFYVCGSKEPDENTVFSIRALNALAAVDVDAEEAADPFILSYDQSIRFVHVKSQLTLELEVR